MSHHPFISILKREFEFLLVLETLPNECYVLIASEPLEFPRVRSLCRRYDVEVSAVTPDSLFVAVSRPFSCDV